MWSNEQYSRHEWLKISSLPSGTEDSQVESRVLKIYDKIYVKVDPQNIEARHRLKSSNNSKKVIIKLSKRGYAGKLREVKKKADFVKFPTDWHL